MISCASGWNGEQPVSGVLTIQCHHCNGEFFHDGSLGGATLPCPNCGETIKMPGVEAPQRSIQDQTLDFAYEVYGQHPVQADGQVQGHPFYFRAKWDFWTFTVCTNSDNENVPSMIDPPEDEPGFFKDGEYEGFYLGGNFGSETDASYMDLDVAETIIRDSVQKFVQAMSSG